MHNLYLHILLLLLLLPPRYTTTVTAACYCLVPRFRSLSIYGPPPNSSTLDLPPPVPTPALTSVPSSPSSPSCPVSAPLPLLDPVSPVLMVPDSPVPVTAPVPISASAFILRAFAIFLCSAAEASLRGEERDRPMYLPCVCVCG
ncbi:hypothetical protein B484DRAFT_295160 [Ochromonadaceae sp. CCMP2298]|nr:hypothetical protein B484DRAFT_295160 [Ochromonadaceae sp. CCMP2298]